MIFNFIQSFRYNKKGLALSNLNKYEDAIKCFDELIKLNKNDASVYLKKGLALKNLNRLDEALIFYDKAIKLRSKLFNCT